MVDLTQVELPAAHDGGQIHAEVDAHDGATDRTAARPGDAQRLPHTAARAVRGDQTAGGDPLAGEFADHLVGRLPQTGELGVEPDGGTRVDGRVAQHRFQDVLRDQARRFGADLHGGPAGRLPQRQLRRLGESAATGHVIVSGEVARRVLDHTGQPEFSEDLHGPEVESACLRLRGRGGPLLHDGHRHAVVAQHQCGGEPDQSAADHEHVNAACTLSTHGGRCTRPASLRPP